MNRAIAGLDPGVHLDELRGNLSSIIRGKSDVIDQMIIGLLAGGSILLEDVPGVGKTTLAKSLARSLDLEFQRVQCTPDLLPADIFGFSVFNPQNGEFEFRSGPIFTNVLLVDEINRASPRTQSALLEAMAEHQVTIEGRHYKLPDPFLVLATQNPTGSQGTFPLPESQLDRFLFQLSLDYPDLPSEVQILYDHMASGAIENLSPVLSRDSLIACQEHVRNVNVERVVAEYLVAIVHETRDDSRIRLGSSPRGTLMLLRSAQACAVLAGRDYVLPDDIQAMAPLVLAHRVSLVERGGATADQRRELIHDLVSRVNVPT